MLIRVIALADINLCTPYYCLITCQETKMVNYAWCAILSSCWSEEAHYSLLDVMDMHVHICAYTYTEYIICQRVNPERPELEYIA